MADPADVKRRRVHILKKRDYKSKGPNNCWHVDGYDELATSFSFLSMNVSTEVVVKLG